MVLARLCLKTKDWECASKATDEEIKLDLKHTYPEMYLHKAVVQYQMKDLAGAESSVQEAIRMDPKHRRAREEYILGRILLAKGDVAGAKEHINKYVELDPNSADIDAIKTELQTLGNAGATAPEPNLEVL